MLVRAEGLEPSRTLRSNGFSYPATAFAAAHSFRNGVWGLDYPFTLPGFAPGVRCCPSSLYTFPARFGRAWLGIAILQGSPNLSSSASPVSRRALKFALKSGAYAISPRPHSFKRSTKQGLTLSDF